MNNISLPNDSAIHLLFKSASIPHKVFKKLSYPDVKWSRYWFRGVIMMSST